MNTDILVYALVSVFTLAIPIVIYLLNKNKIITEEYLAKILPQIIVGSGLFFEIVNSLDLKQEPQIKKISKVVDETLKYIELNIDKDITDEQVLSYIDAMCIMFDIKLNESQMNIAKKLLEIGINEIKTRIDSVKM